MDIINKIEKKICSLDQSDKDYINWVLLFHECEPSAAAERISEHLNVSYESIYELLP